MFLFRKHLVPSLRSFSTTRFAARFNETEAAKIAREDSRKQLNLTHHDESFDNENVYRLSRRKVTPGTEDKIKEYMEKTARRIRKVPGLIEVEVLVSSDDSQTFHVLTHWSDAHKLDDWVDSDLCHEVNGFLTVLCIIFIYDIYVLFIMGILQVYKVSLELLFCNCTNLSPSSSCCILFFQ